MTPRIAILALGLCLLAACEAPETETAEPAAANAEAGDLAASDTAAEQPVAITITADALGAARVGMTLGELRQVFPDATFEVQSPFMVDIDAISVTLDAGTHFHVLHLASDSMDDSSTIELLMTDSAAYRTAEGIGPGSSIAEAEAVYGAATLSYNTSSESREQVAFADLPYEGMSLWTDYWGSGEFAGVYPESGSEYVTTGSYREDAAIGYVLLRR